MCEGQETVILSKSFRTLFEGSGVIPQFSGTESHNSIDVVKSNHRTLQRRFSVILPARPQLHPESALRLALQGMNDTMGPDRLDSTLLAFFHTAYHSK